MRMLLNYVGTLTYKDIKSKWQNEWHEHRKNKLCNITPCIEDHLHHHAGCRQDQVFTRCYFGQSSLTHAFLHKGEPSQECTGCLWRLSLKTHSA